MSKVYFSGCGLVSSLGKNTNDNIQKLLQLSDEKQVAPRKKISYSQDKSSIRALLHAIAVDDKKNRRENNEAILDSVITEAIVAAQLSNKEIERLGIFVGSTSIDINVTEEKIIKSNPSKKNLGKSISPFSELNDYIVKKYNIRGPSYSFHTACTSSANALIYAAEFIKSKEIDHALVIGIELHNQTSIMGFNNLGLMSSSEMRPFDKDRDGLFLGEACGAVILSRKPSGHFWGLEAGAYLCDNYNVSTCNPNGSSGLFI
jgi:3-oxoacyl-[acyl-carrier-protein] synthase-1